MLGAIIGDIAGSAYERNPVKTGTFEIFGKDSRFTDDTVMTAATAQALLVLRDNEEISEQHISKVYATMYRRFYQEYPCAGYGHAFAKWAQDGRLLVQGSYGNGASMRVSPIGFALGTLKEVLNHAEKSCLYTHNNREAISGAQAVAGSVFLARQGKTKGEIRRFVQKTAGYNLNFKLDDINLSDGFTSRTKYSVPLAITAFMESDSFESAVRKAVALGGDSGTIACIAGGIAQAFYGDIPLWMEKRALEKLDGRLASTVREFTGAFIAE